MAINYGATYPRVVELLKTAVAEKGQRAISRSSGVPLPNIQGYLKGIGVPTTKTLQKLADYFGVSVAELRGEVRVVVGGMTVSPVIAEAAAKSEKQRLIAELKQNEKIIDHLHQVGSTLVDAWLVENQEEVLKDLTFRQGQIVGELKEMGIDIFDDPDWREKNLIEVSAVIAADSNRRKNVKTCQQNKSPMQ